MVEELVLKDVVHLAQLASARRLRRVDGRQQTVATTPDLPRRALTVTPITRRSPLQLPAAFTQLTQLYGTLHSTRGRKHVYKVGGPIPWSRLLYRTKYGWYTQFRALQSVT